MTKKDECKALYNLNDDQANYLLQAASTFVFRIKELGGLSSSDDKEIALGAIEADELIQRYNMTQDMAKAFLEFVVPFVWDKVLSAEDA